MKSKSALLVSVLFALLHGPAFGAETPAAAAAEIEWTMTLGCRHCHFAEQTGITMCGGNCGPAAMKDGKVFLLEGAAVPKDFKKSGTWVIKGTVSPDGKEIAVKAMTPQLPTPAELKSAPSAPPTPGAKPFTGQVARTGAGLPMLTTADKTRYALKTAKTASVATNYMLTRIGGGELTGNFSVTGTTYEDDTHTWIVIDSIQTVAAPARP